MGLELEVKVLDLDLDRVEEKLIALGARLLKKEIQKNYLIDDFKRSIEKSQDGYLRIRESENILTGEKKLTMTYKENLNRKGLRSNMERNVSIEIEDRDSLIYILKLLGYENVSLGTKERRSYMLHGIKFDLDTWDKETYPYPYMEIEVEKEEDLERAIELLGLDRDKITTDSITDLREKLQK